jgi:UDP-galactopyranose mutase
VGNAPVRVDHFRGGWLDMQYAGTQGASRPNGGPRDTSEVCLVRCITALPCPFRVTMSTPRVLIVGAGLTGCTLSYRLAQHGIESELLERSAAPGGLIRSERMEGVLYEPHGSHIFHTEDREVWELANQMTPFRLYRHRVDIVADGQLFNWPILLSDIERQSRSDEIFRQLEERRDVDSEGRAQAANFEEWCLELMGPILYERFIRPYTEKQWGRPARELSATWAPRRVSVRWDNDPYLFPDPFQGWPAGPGGYTDLIDGLLAGAGATLRTGVDVTVDNLEQHMRDAQADLVVLTCPLDVFCGFDHGSLEWRGILIRNVHVPHVELAQGAMVVNYPGPEFPFIRIHETKHASGQRCEGTVLGFEFTNAPTRYYPIETERNRALNDKYQAHLRELIGPGRTFFAGRLANYLYIDMDDCMRQALDASDEVIQAVGSVT